MIAKVGFGGGCHWCTEGIFVSLRGVEKVEQGWIAAPAPDDTFSEAVIVHFDPEQISVKDLITIHLETHASSSNHPMRAKYRSAIYAFEIMDFQYFQELLRAHNQKQEQPLITRVLHFESFRASEEKYQDYFRKNPEKPFCQTYISPKLQQIKRQHPSLLK